MRELLDRLNEAKNPKKVPLKSRSISALLKRNGIKPIEVHGSQLGLEVEVSEKDSDKASDILRQATGVNWGGYRAGHGAWVYSPEYKAEPDFMSDFNSPHSRHHY